MNFYEGHYRKVREISLDRPSMCIEYAENSPLKILKTYFAEKKLEEAKFKRNSSHESSEKFKLNYIAQGINSIFSKKKLREETYKYINNGGNLNFRNSTESPPKTSEHLKFFEVKSKLRESPSKLLVLVSNLSEKESSIDIMNKEINSKRKELIRNHSAEKVDAKLGLYYNKLIKIRSQYQQQLITKCKKLSRQYSSKEYKKL